MPYFSLGQTEAGTTNCSYVGIDAKDASGQKTLETIGCKLVSTDGIEAKYCCPKAAAEQMPPDIRETVSKIGQGLFHIPSDMLNRVQQSLDAAAVAAPPPPSVVTPSDVLVTEQVYPQETGLLAKIKAHPYITLGVAALGVYLWSRSKYGSYGYKKAADDLIQAQEKAGWPPVSEEDEAIEQNPARLGPNHRLLWEGGKYFSVQEKRGSRWQNVGSITKQREGRFTAKAGRQTKANFPGPYSAARWVLGR